MATFQSRKKKDGTITIYAQIRLKKAGKVVFSENNSFQSKGAEKVARLWELNREEVVRKLLYLGKRVVSLFIALGMIRYLDEHVKEHENKSWI